ncbi:copper homeostasis protein CutC [Psychroserpens sp.]|uniref:copper homeostasis protein CutC n=1 Tax=Psychroserpens sp. TaxID=2020870 RepID=UPI001B2BE24F|nr:copper homeostasis protein CutC [Psychroserpens sp.]MBO6606811.1 copper homeostasis protein CutC [Psychroserpens sp.]MBO6632824.1 copper homeostasis protein CutC [Psychroserpens sp.]MBO6653514.1 copper homeostasis protein CutC [Psychroserpens sp.]MBO6680458.1 copper homeostasis protein CutC [Psychroserpens sp.]MBO6750583.1 copper homeostasis protein CutC [Psychroserpens sp.]
MLLEICANSYQSAYNAQHAGAHRIELCSELSVGGITPSHGLIKQVISELTIDTFVLIRPRSGNFNYNDSEFEVMKTDIEFCKSVGCHGIVSGVLNADQTLDLKRTLELIELAKPLSFTFHRAFDLVPDPLQTLDQLIELGVDRILTSGQQTKAIDGLDLLIELNKRSQEKLIILPGSGININNVTSFKNSGFKEIHSSASKVVSNNQSGIFDTQLTVSSMDNITAILNRIHE